jgi:glutamyl-tRNA reductase
MTQQGVPHLDSRGSPDSSLVAVGVSHADAHVAVRESVYLDCFGRAELRHLLAAAGEVVVLSTCNRTELYIAAADHESAKAAAAALLARVGDGRAQADAARALVSRRGLDVARHLFRVAAGLESVVLGETEILGQVRKAWLESQEANTAGPLLNALFQRALESGRRVRAETPLARRPASVASAAVELADRAAGGLAGRHVVVLGAGAVARALCLSLLRRRVGVVTIVARNAERAAAISAGCDARVAPLGELDQQLESADVVVAATSAPHPLITADMLPRRARADRRRLVVIDLGVPRNVDPVVAHLDFCQLYDVDDLRLVVEATVAARNEAVATAEVILEHDLERFRDWLIARGLKQEIAQIRLRAEALRATELSQLLEAAGAVDRSTLAKLERLAAKRAGLFVHEQVSLLKAAPA